MTTERTFYEPGEEVVVAVAQCNLTDEVITQRYGCPFCHDTYMVVDAQGEQVAYCAPGCISAVVGRTWQPGGMAIFSILGLHRKKAAWHEPLRFDPERRAFLEGSYDRFDFLPFITGPRVCGGAALAQMELEQGLAAIVSRYRLSISGEAPGLDYAVTWRPANPGAVAFALRR